jgi:hypothetical protein
VAAVEQPYQADRVDQVDQVVVVQVALAVLEQTERLILVEDKVVLHNLTVALEDLE